MNLAHRSRCADYVHVDTYDVRRYRLRCGFALRPRRLDAERQGLFVPLSMAARATIANVLGIGSAVALPSKRWALMSWLG